MDKGSSSGASGSGGSLIALSDTWYRPIFIPYAVTFFIYVVAGTIATLTAHRFGIGEETIKFILIPALFVLGAIIFTSRKLWRSTINRRARKRSLNPNAVVLTEIHGLVFKDDAVVDVRFSFRLRAAIEGLTTYRVIMFWNGDPSTIVIAEEDGCHVGIAQVREGAGQEVTATFPPLIKETVYTFSFTLRITNSDRQIRRFVRKTSPYLAEEELILTMESRDDPTRRFVETIYASGSSQIALKTNYQISESPAYSYRIVRPRQGWSYKLAVQQDLT